MKVVVLAPLQPVGKRVLEESLEVVYAGWATAHPVVTRLPSDAEIIELACYAQGIIVPGELSRQVIDNCADLRVIGVARGDPRGVDLEAASARGIPVVYAAGRNAAAVAELTLGFIIMLSRQLLSAHGFVSEHRWRTWADLFATPLVSAIELAGRTLGLVGFGFVGQEVTRRALAFDLDVLVYDPYVPEHVITQRGAESVSLNELMSRSDFVSVHCKVTNETRGMIGRQELNWMKRGAYFINTARADIVDEASLFDALHSGRLAGAALDVYWREPLPTDSRWLALPNVIHTPHIGGATSEVELRTSEMITHDVLAVLSGAPPRFVANPSVLADGCQ